MLLLIQLYQKYSDLIKEKLVNFVFLVISTVNDVAMLKIGPSYSFSLTSFIVYEGFLTKLNFDYFYRKNGSIIIRTAITIGCNYIFLILQNILY